MAQASNEALRIANNYAQDGLPDTAAALRMFAMFIKDQPPLPEKK